MSEVLGEALSNVSKKLNSLENDLVAQLKELDKRGIKWFQYDAKKEKLIEEGAETKIVKINVGGKTFNTSLLTILNHPDTLLFNLIMTESWDFNDELFIDRSYKYFHLVLSYMRNNELCLSNYNENEVKDVLNEAKYYHMYEMYDHVDYFCREVKFVGYEFSGEYRSGTTLVGTNNIEDLNNFEDTSCTKGICTNYTGWIIIELNREVEISKLEIGGYRGNTNLYANSNGSGAQIKTSLDKTTWTTVGSINSQYANGPYIHDVTTSSARYIQFEHNSYLGIGYLRIITEK